MAVKVIVMKKGDFTKEVELQKLIKEGWVVTGEKTDPITGATTFNLSEATNFTM